VAEFHEGSRKTKRKRKDHILSELTVDSSCYARYKNDGFHWGRIRKVTGTGESRLYSVRIYCFYVDCLSEIWALIVVCTGRLQ
jgi:hypothetical protein